MSNLIIGLVVGFIIGAFKSQIVEFVKWVISLITKKGQPTQ